MIELNNFLQINRAVLCLGKNLIENERYHYLLILNEYCKCLLLIDQHPLQFLVNDCDTKDQFDLEILLCYDKVSEIWRLIFKIERHYYLIKHTDLYDWKCPKQDNKNGNRNACAYVSFPDNVQMKFWISSPSFTATTTTATINNNNNINSNKDGNNVQLLYNAIMTICQEDMLDFESGNNPFIDCQGLMTTKTTTTTTNNTNTTSTNINSNTSTNNVAVNNDGIAENAKDTIQKNKSDTVRSRHRIMFASGSTQSNDNENDNEMSNDDSNSNDRLSAGENMINNKCSSYLQAVTKAQDALRPVTTIEYLQTCAMSAVALTPSNNTMLHAQDQNGTTTTNNNNNGHFNNNDHLSSSGSSSSSTIHVQDCVKGYANSLVNPNENLFLYEEISENQNEAYANLQASLNKMFSGKNHSINPQNTDQFNSSLADEIEESIAQLNKLDRMSALRTVIPHI